MKLTIPENSKEFFVFEIRILRPSTLLKPHGEIFDGTIFRFRFKNSDFSIEFYFFEAQYKTLMYK